MRSARRTTATDRRSTSNLATVSTLLIAGLLIVQPALILAQPGSADDVEATEEIETAPPAPNPVDDDYTAACTDGEEYADRNHNATGYMVGGLFCGIIGFAIAAASSPKPPADLLIGKSPDYTTVFTQCYEKQAKSKNTKAACGGWAAGAALAIGIYSLASTLDEANSL